jgi:hypothetical protein
MAVPLRPDPHQNHLLAALPGNDYEQMVLMGIGA